MSEKYFEDSYDLEEELQTLQRDIRDYLEEEHGIETMEVLGPAIEVVEKLEGEEVTAGEVLEQLSENLQAWKHRDLQIKSRSRPYNEGSRPGSSNGVAQR